MSWSSNMNCIIFAIYHWYKRLVQVIIKGTLQDFKITSFTFWMIQVFDSFVVVFISFCFVNIIIIVLLIGA